MRYGIVNFGLVLLMFVQVGCDQKANRPGPNSYAKSVQSEVEEADVSILFIGNSHTAMHDLPDVVCAMIQFRHPGRKVCSHYIPVSHLEVIPDLPRCRDEIETRPWKHVVLQAQKISVSGKFDYSRQEGIDFAKLAKSRSAKVWFYSEWGLQNVAGDGERNEKIYREMAAASEAGVVPVGRAWDLALSRRKDLVLHLADGNHQNETGAFLTACVLYGRITGESPAPLAEFKFPEVNSRDRKFLADVAAEVLAEYQKANP